MSRNNNLTPAVVIDIDRALGQLSEAELHTLHHKIVDRLKLLRKIRQLKAMSRFSLDDQVQFQHHDQRITGKIIRLNRQTVTVHTAGHQDWKVSPALLSKVISV